ncbi:hypothetical protein MPF_1367 [Methanohalophilus portucalensis FDF-1]|uniref:Uncharacterized protein n=1 Tax=Methanohalophilus portucalensis FDF-1 TaxID=523843 RepID=A0A1L9C306_9EURY|nr:hypothetical protein MPF_1367 [Methanohalophilus portucalensis FDF-1]
MYLTVASENVCRMGQHKPFSSAGYVHPINICD